MIPILADAESIVGLLQKQNESKKDLNFFLRGGMDLPDTLSVPKYLS